MRAISDLLEVLKGMPSDHFAFIVVLCALGLAFYAIRMMAAVAGGRGHDQ